MKTTSNNLNKGTKDLYTTSRNTINQLIQKYGKIKLILFSFIFIIATIILYILKTIRQKEKY
jgi:hypothetical protein